MKTDTNINILEELPGIDSKKILNFRNTNRRNSIVFLNREYIDIKFLDLGKLLSCSLLAFINENKLSMRADLELNSILESNIAHNQEFGSYLALKNLGILFEPDLKLDFNTILEKHSRDKILFIYWEGDFDDKSCYFLSKENGKKVNLTDISYIVL